MKIMTRQGLPYFNPALLDSGKSATVNSLVMLLVCHPFVICSCCVKDFAFRIPPVPFVKGGLILLAKVQYRSN
jgi:hypothetical protein